MKAKKIGILHYRVGKTDGVSLEIKKRTRILKNLGYEVKLIAGVVQEGADYVIRLLEFDLPEVLKIRHNAFESFEDFKNDQEFRNYIGKIADSIKKDFLEIHEKENFEYLFLHNIFTHGRHIASAKALSEIAGETNIKVISVNHDFYWLGSYRDIYQPTTEFVKKYLSQYSPPLLPQITHVVINSISQDALEEKIHQPSLLLPDIFNFDQAQWKIDEYNRSFLKDIGLKENDLIILQATRISERKGIELAIDLVSGLNKHRESLIGKTLYNGKKITPESDLVLVLAGYAEQDSLDYRKLLEEKVNRLNLKAKFICDSIGAERTTQNNHKVYSLWDAYVFADLVTFPSLWEGWGNQFIEAVFAKKPVVVFEYPVFARDIKKEGYRVISLGSIATPGDDGLVKIPDDVLRTATEETISILNDRATNSLVNNNYEVGKKYHSDEFLEKKLKEILKVADQRYSLK